MISQRRRYLAMREQARAEKLVMEGTCLDLSSCIWHANGGQTRYTGLPNIIVSGGEPMTPPMSPRDITSPHSAYMGLETPRIRTSVLSPEGSYALETPSRSSLQRSKRVSDVSMLSTSFDLGVRTSYVTSCLVCDTRKNILHPSFDGSASRESRIPEEDSGEVLSSLQNSMWGGK